ncbi:unnamed protein product, partial [Pylaiella littoralis]
QVAYVDRAHQIPDNRGRHSVLGEVGERAEGCGVLFRYPEGPLQNTQARHDLPEAGAPGLRVLHVLHPAQ